MTSYAYEGVGRAGERQRGVVRAESVEQVRERLAGEGVLAVSVKREGGLVPFPGRSRVRGRDAAAGLQALATLLHAGLPVDEALGALGTIAPSGWLEPSENIRRAVRAGRPLSEALADSVVDLPPAAYGILAAAEAAGSLPAGVQRAGDLLADEAELRASIRGALAYPLLLTLAGAAATALLVGVVLPRFSQILSELGQELPTTTRVVLSSGEAVRTLAAPITVLGGVVAVAVTRWTRSADGKKRWHALLLRTPGVRVVRLAAGSARACAALGALLSAGCPLPSALARAGKASGDMEIERRLIDARGMVARGDRLSRSLQTTLALSAPATRLIAVGERGGRLAEMATKAGVTEAERTERMLQRAVGLVEPAMILAFGLCVALIAAALLQAVYAVRPI